MNRHAMRTLTVTLAIPASITACTQAVLAAEEKKESVNSAVRSIETGELPQQQIEPLVIRDDACLNAAPISESGKQLIGCAFGSAALGLDLSFRQEHEGHSIVFRALAARQTHGALSLDRLMFDQNRGMAEESSLAGFVSDVGLFDGRLNLDSTVAWSNRWLFQQANTTNSLLLNREERGAGSAQSHQLTVVPVDRPRIRWSLTAGYAHAGRDYYAGSFSPKLQISAFAGSRSAIASSLSVDKWRLKTSFANHNSLFAKSDTSKLKISRGGISINIADQFSVTTPTVEYAFLPLSQSVKRTVGLEFDLYSLLPKLAIDDSFPAILVPKYSVVTYEQRITSLVNTGHEYRRRSFDFLGMWDSKMGDTDVNYRVDRKRPFLGALRASDDTMLSVAHSIRLGDWRIGLDASATNSRSGENVSGSRSVGGSVRYSRPEGPEFELRMGRDNSAYNWGSGTISSRDFGLHVNAMLDLTQWLRNQLKRDDMHLAFEYRHRMRESQFDIDLMEGFIESEQDRFVRRGFLMSFSMKLP